MATRNNEKTRRSALPQRPVRELQNPQRAMNEQQGGSSITRRANPQAIQQAAQQRRTANSETINRASNRSMKQNTSETRKKLAAAFKKAR